MACFLVPAAEAIVTTIVTKVVKKKEAAAPEKTDAVSVRLDDETVEKRERIPFSSKMRWLNGLLWGGSCLLAFEHLWHGEVTPWFPFLTAAESPDSLQEMFHEMSTVGVSMAVLVTAIWGVMVAVTSILEKKAVVSDSELIPEKE